MALLLILAIAALMWRLLRQPDPRRCAWCGKVKRETVAWHGGHVCTDCAAAATQPGDHY